MRRESSNLYIDIVKEIILCDYNHVEYNPKTDDDLLSSVAIVKGRKKVFLTTKNSLGRMVLLSLSVQILPKDFTY
jgi:hypothetical protein